jgi:hypothetical protein
LCFFFFFFGGTGVWIQGLTLSRQAFHQLFLFLGVGIYVTLTGRWHTKKEGDWWGLQSPSAIFCAFHIQFLFFLFSVLWFWTQGLPLLGRCSTTWALTLFFFFFCFGYFWDRVWLFAQVGLEPQTSWSVSCIARITSVSQWCLAHFFFHIHFCTIWLIYLLDCKFQSIIHDVFLYLCLS